MNEKTYTRSMTWILLLFLLLSSGITGCCTRTTPKKGKKGPIKQDSADSLLTDRSVEGGTEKLRHRRVIDELKTGDPHVDEQRRRKTEQYRRLEYAHEMLMNSNSQAALREVERLQMDIRDDSYLEMKTWYLSAMIYHKMGKTSRRKRSMRKMLECMETLQKDPRFKAAYKDGQDANEVIKMAISKEGEKYAE